MISLTARVAGVLTLAASLTALTGCAGGPAASPSASGAGNGAPVTIEYLHRLPDGEGMTKVSQLVDQWNKANPDIQVKATKFDGKAAELITKLEADVKAGTAPCLAQAGGHRPLPGPGRLRRDPLAVHPWAPGRRQL